MNRKTPILVALILIALPSFASSVEFDFTEDFEDDTVGQNPTGTYTFIEESGGGANVISGGHTGQGLDVVANSWAAFNDIQGVDFCSDGQPFSFWVKPAYGGATGQGGMIVIGKDTPSASDGDVRDFELGGQIIIDITAATSTTFTVSIAVDHNSLESTAVISGGSPETFGGWYKMVLDNFNCFSSNPSVRLSVYDSGEVLINSGTETCNTCTAFDAGTYDVVGFGDGNSGASGNVLLDLDTFNGGAAIPPAPPGGLVGEVKTVGGPTVTGIVELVFPLSPDDPDQDTGTLTYEVHDQVGFVANADWFQGDGFGRYNYTYGGTGPFGDFTFHIVTDDSGVDSVDSCTITLNLDTLGDAGACGDSGEVPVAPNGLNALVQVAVTATQGTVELRFPLSSNDPDQDTGLFTYTPYIDAIQGFADTIDGDDGDGFRKATISLTDPSPGEVQFRVKATNTTNGLSSSFSCSVFIDVSQRFNVGNCGTMPLPGTPAGGGGGPLFDIQPLVDASGASASAIGWVAGIAITIGLAFGGIFYFGPLGGLAGGALGIGFATAVGWFPLWFIVFVVLLLAGAFVAFRGQ